MSAIRGKVTGGKIEIPAPPDWPDGLEVEVRPADEEFGCTEDEQGDDPESIAEWLAWYDTVQPLILTPEDEARWAAARQAQKEYELSKWDEHSEKLRKMWE
jgi:hypothetical protein